MVCTLLSRKMEFRQTGNAVDRDFQNTLGRSTNGPSGGSPSFNNSLDTNNIDNALAREARYNQLAGDIDFGDADGSIASLGDRHFKDVISYALRGIEPGVMVDTGAASLLGGLTGTDFNDTTRAELGYGSLTQPAIQKYGGSNQNEFGYFTQIEKKEYQELLDANSDIPLWGDDAIRFEELDNKYGGSSAENVEPGFINNVSKAFDSYYDAIDNTNPFGFVTPDYNGGILNDTLEGLYANTINASTVAFNGVAQFGMAAGLIVPALYGGIFGESLEQSEQAVFVGAISSPFGIAGAGILTPRIAVSKFATSAQPFIGKTFRYLEKRTRELSSTTGSNGANLFAKGNVPDKNYFNGVKNVAPENQDLVVKLQKPENIYDIKVTQTTRINSEGVEVPTNLISDRSDLPFIADDYAIRLNGKSLDDWYYTEKINEHNKTLRFYHEKESHGKSRFEIEVNPSGHAHYEGPHVKVTARVQNNKASGKPASRSTIIKTFVEGQEQTPYKGWWKW